jgi:hypothetical protein
MDFTIRVVGRRVDRIKLEHYSFRGIKLAGAKTKKVDILAAIGRLKHQHSRLPLAIADRLS